MYASIGCAIWASHGRCLMYLSLVVGWNQVMCRLHMFDQAFEALEVMERGGFE